MAINVQDLFREDPYTYRTPGIGDGIPGNIRIDGSVNPIYNQAAPETVGTDTINVNGIQPGSMAQTAIAPEDLIPRSLDNRDFISQRDQDNKNGREATQHKGLFGVKGTLRDVLGFLGDSLLVGSGKDAIYGKTRQRELEGDAMAGFTQDPLGASERMTGINPGRAQELQELAINEQIKQAQLKSMDAQRRSVIDQNSLENITKLRNLAARMLGSPGGQKNPELAFKQINDLARGYGVSIEQLGLRPDMTPEERDIYASGDMTIQQQRNLPMRERQLDIAQQNASANTTRANRPPAGRAAPNPTAASIAAPVLEKLKRGQKLAPNEIELLDRAGYNMPNQGRGGRQRPSQTNPAPARRFRILN